MILYKKIKYIIKVRLILNIGLLLIAKFKIFLLKIKIITKSYIISIKKIYITENIYFLKIN